MDWAPHVPHALLRTSVNTFLCLADSLGGGASHSGWASSKLLSRRCSQMVDHLSWVFSRAPRSECGRNETSSMLDHLFTPEWTKGNPMPESIINYYSFILIVPTPFWEVSSRIQSKKKEKMMIKPPNFN